MNQLFTLPETIKGEVTVKLDTQSLIKLGVLLVAVIIVAGMVKILTKNA